jgi:hypothetical protein
VYTELKLDLILETIGTLHRRIAERFPEIVILDTALRPEPAT